MADNKAVPSSSGSVRSVASVRSRAAGRMPSTLEALNSFDTVERRNAVEEALRSFQEGLIARPHDSGWSNVLVRTFFSYSAEGFSPSRLVWEAVIRGLSVIGSADRDNLGALREMLAVGDALDIRATVSLETAVRVPSRSDNEFNLPGRPGMIRVLGAGFVSVPSLTSEHGRLIAALAERSRARARALVEKLNPVLAPVTVDFDADVASLAPAGNAMEAHVFRAYGDKSRAMFSELHDLAVFWSDVLGRSPTDVECLLSNDPNAFMEALADKLARLGEPDVCPVAADGLAADEFFRAVRAAGAVPCLLWLDGTSAGEADPVRLLDDAVEWGARAVALTPDRNWNLSDPAEKEKRLAALAAMTAAARERNLPLLAGSPMSEPRQKFVDSFDAPEIAAYFRDFTDSAFWLYGHGVLERAAGLGLSSAWAERTFAGDPAAANAFYLEVGKKAAPGPAAPARIAALGDDPATDEILAALAPLRL